MAIDILDPKTVQRIISDIETQQIRDRRRYEYKQHLCYSGRLREFVEAKLEAALPEDSKWIEVIDINIVQKIIDKLAKSYREAPKREVEGDDIKTQAIGDIYKEGEFNETLDIFDHRVTLHKFNALWVVKREDQPIKLETVPSYAFFPIFDAESGEMEACVLNYPGTDITHYNGNTNKGTGKLDGTIKFQGGDGVDQIVAESSDDSNPNGSTFAMWTRDQHAVYEVEKVEGDNGIETVIKFVKINDNDDLNGVNDLGVIPFVYFSTEKSIELPVRNPLSDQAVTYNYYMSGLLGAAIRNIGTATLKRPEGMDMDVLTSGLSTAVDLPQSRKEGDPATEFGYENPNSDLSGQLTVYLSVLQQIFGQYGIRSNESVGGTSVLEFNSGLERMIANADVQDHIEKMQNRYLNVEQKVFKIVQAYLESEDGLANVFDPEDEITVIFQKPKITISDSEKLANLEKRKAMKLMSRVGQVMELDPNLGESKAKEFLEKVDEELDEERSSSINAVARMVSDEDQDDINDPTNDVTENPLDRVNATDDSGN